MIDNGIIDALLRTLQGGLAVIGAIVFFYAAYALVKRSNGTARYLLILGLVLFAISYAILSVLAESEVFYSLLFSLSQSVGVILFCSGIIVFLKKK